MRKLTMALLGGASICLAVTIALLPHSSPPKFAAYFGDEVANIYA